MSLCTVIVNSSVDSLPSLSFAVTFTLTSLTSSGFSLSESSQSLISGLPVIFLESLSNVTPFGSPSTVISASGSSVLTSISLIGCFSTTVWSPILSIFGAVVSFLSTTLTGTSTLSVVPSL